MESFVTGALGALGFLTVALMAYYATRKEPPGPRCPRCLNRVKPGAATCRSCGLPLEWLSEEEANP